MIWPIWQAATMATPSHQVVPLTRRAAAAAAVVARVRRVVVVGAVRREVEARVCRCFRVGLSFLRLARPHSRRVCAQHSLSILSHTHHRDVGARPA